MTDWFWEQAIEKLKENVISSSHYQRVWLCLLQSCTNVFYLFLRHFPYPQVGGGSIEELVADVPGGGRYKNILSSDYQHQDATLTPPASCLLPPVSLLPHADSHHLLSDCGLLQLFYQSQTQQCEEYIPNVLQCIVILRWYNNLFFIWPVYPEPSVVTYCVIGNWWSLKP